MPACRGAGVALCVDFHGSQACCASAGFSSEVHAAWRLTAAAAALRGSCCCATSRSCGVCVRRVRGVERCKQACTAACCLCSRPALAEAVLLMCVVSVLWLKSEAGALVLWLLQPLVQLGSVVWCVCGRVQLQEPAACHARSTLHVACRAVIFIYILSVINPLLTV